MRWLTPFVALLLAGCQTSALETAPTRMARISAPPKTVGMDEDQVAALFRRAVLADEIGRDQPLVRWDKPALRVSVEGNASAPWFDYVRVVFAVLAQESGLSISIAPADWGADIVVTIFTGWALESDVAQGDCGAQTRYDGGRMVMAVVAIDATQQTNLNLMRSCLYEESFQAMGLTGETNAGLPTLIDERRNYTGLTPADRILLRTLYDPRLRTGMTWAEAEPLVRTIIREQMAR